MHLVLKKNHTYSKNIQLNKYIPKGLPELGHNNWQYFFNEDSDDFGKFTISSQLVVDFLSISFDVVPPINQDLFRSLINFNAKKSIGILKIGSKNNIVLYNLS